MNLEKKIECIELKVREAIENAALNMHYYIELQLRNKLTQNDIDDILDKLLNTAIQLSESAKEKMKEHMRGEPTPQQRMALMEDLDLYFSSLIEKALEIVKEKLGGREDIDMKELENNMIIAAYYEYYHLYFYLSKEYFETENIKSIYADLKASVTM